MSRDGEPCEMCGREKPLQFHHLIPRKLHKKRVFAKRYDKFYMRKKGIMICRDCHNALHDLFDLKTLGLDLNELSKILAHPKIRNYLNYIKKTK